MNLTAQGKVILLGDVLVEGPSKVNVTLLDQSELTGAMQEVNDVTGVKVVCAEHDISDQTYREWRDEHHL